DRPISGSVQFLSEGGGILGASGVPVTMVVNGQANSSFPYTVSGHASIHLDTAGSGASTQVGSIIVTPAGSSNAPLAEALFSQSSNGTTVTQLVMPAQSASNAVRMYISVGTLVSLPESFSVVGGSAIAITNTAATPTLVNVELFRWDGTTTGLKKSLTIPPMGHTARFIHELFPEAVPNIESSHYGPPPGLARITSASSPIVVAGLLAEYN